MRPNVNIFLNKLKTQLTIVGINYVTNSVIAF